MTSTPEGFGRSDPDAVGRTVELSDILRWFDQKRLEGRTELGRLDQIRQDAELMGQSHITKQGLREARLIQGAKDELLSELGKVLFGEIMMPPLPIQPDEVGEA